MIMQSRVLALDGSFVAGEPGVGGDEIEILCAGWGVDGPADITWGGGAGAGVWGWAGAGCVLFGGDVVDVAFPVAVEGLSVD